MTTDSPGTVHRDIEFHETPERTLRLDVYEPTDAAPGGPRPTVVCFHGGGFHSGEKAQESAQIQALADRGYVVVTPEYRLSGEATFPAALVDAKAAVEWCRAESETYGIDPQRIATAGHSAGANLATLVSAIRARWQAGRVVPERTATFVVDSGLVVVDDAERELRVVRE